MFNPQLDELTPYKIEVGRVENRENFSGVYWTSRNMIDLKKGDLFRAFDSEGNRVIHENGKDQLLATSGGYVDEILKIPAVNIIA